MAPIAITVWPIFKKISMYFNKKTSNLIYVETKSTNFLEWSQLGCLPIRNLLPCHWIRTNITKQNDRFSAKKPTHTRYWSNRQQHMCYIVGATTTRLTIYLPSFDCPNHQFFSSSCSVTTYLKQPHHHVEGENSFAPVSIKVCELRNLWSLLITVFKVES